MGASFTDYRVESFIETPSKAVMLSVLHCGALQHPEALLRPLPLYHSCALAYKISEKCPLASGSEDFSSGKTSLNRSFKVAGAGVAINIHHPSLSLLVGWCDNVGCPGRLPGSQAGAKRGETSAHGR